MNLVHVPKRPNTPQDQINRLRRQVEQLQKMVLQLHARLNQVENLRHEDV